MNVSELYELSEWVRIEIVEAQIPQLYKNLHAKLNHNTQQNQQMQEFELETATLIEAVENVPIYKLTNQQKSLLDDLNMTPFISNEGKRYIEEVLYKHGLDMATAAKKIKEAQNAINEATSKTNAVKDSLSSFVDHDDLTHDDRYLMRVCFDKEAGIHNFTNMKKWSAEWWSITRGIAMALDKSPEDIEIVGVSNGSVIIDLLVDYGTIVLFSKIIHEGLKITERVLNIIKMAQEIKQKGYNNDAAKKLVEGAEKEKEETIKKIVQEISVEININANETRGDKINELEKAVTKLVNFLNKGGDVDFIPPQIEEYDEVEEAELSADEKKLHKQQLSLRSRFEEIRQIESQIKQIENHSN